MFFGTESLTARARVVQRSRFNFLREAQIWYNRSPEEESRLDEIENVIVLSDEFYTGIMGHPVPTDLEVVKVLTASPGLLDLFMWLSYRCFMAKGEESIPIFGPFGLVAQIGSAEMYPTTAHAREAERVVGNHSADLAAVSSAHQCRWREADRGSQCCGFGSSEVVAQNSRREGVENSRPDRGTRALN